MKSSFSVEQLRLPLGGSHGPHPEAPQNRARRRSRDPFIMGPISRDWLLRVGKEPGRTTDVAMQILYRCGLKRSDTVDISLSAIERDCGFSRSTASRALRALEKVELVTVTRHPGRKPIVTIPPHVRNP